MRFTINEKYINRRKKDPYIVIFFCISLPMIMSMPLICDNDINLKQLIFIHGTVFLAGVFLGLSNLKQFLKYARNHYIEITDDGIKDAQFDLYTVIPWNLIVDIKVKKRGSEIIKLELIINNGDSSNKYDLSRYSHLNDLVREVANRIKM